MTIGTTNLNLKPESLHKVQKHLATKAKPSKPKADRRAFPKDDRGLYSTASYVKAYLELNNIHYKRHNGDLHNEYTLNLAPTTWPTGEDTYEEVRE
jgi:hypothetical protein